MSGPWEQYGASTGPWTQYSGRSKPAPKKPNTAGDVGQSFMSGLLSGVGQIADAVDPVNQMIRAFPGGPVAQIALKPLEAFTAHGLAGTLGGNRQPQTNAGRYAKTIGEFVPNAAVGGTGGVVRRAAQVVVPAVASEAAGQIAEKTGAPPIVQSGARVLGAVAGGGVSAMRTPPRRVAAPLVSAPAVEQLKAQKTAAYKAVDDMGVTFKPEAATSLATDIANLVHGEGGAALYPKAAAMAGRVQQVIGEGPLTLTKLDKLRAQVGDVVTKEEPKIGYAIRNAIDDFIDGADQSKLASGGEGAAAAIRKARALNTRFKKVEEVTNRLDSADLAAQSTYAGGNKNNAVRQKLRPLIDPKSPQRMRNLTPDEAKALNTAVRGSPAQNAVRLAGKTLDPRGLLGGVIQGTLGVGTHGLSLPSAGFGMAATALGTKMAEGNVTRLINIMARGGEEGKAAASQIVQSEPATFEATIKELRASLGERYARDLQIQRQRLLMGTSGLLASGSSAAAQTPDQGLPPQRRQANQR